MGFSSQAFADDTDNTLDENSAYTVMPADAPCENIITNYEYESSTGELTPVYYKIELNETTYGSG